MYACLNFSPIEVKQLYRTDFSDYAIASPISHADWTETLGTTNFTRSTEADGPSLSGRRLRLSITSGTNQQRALRYVPAGSPTDVEVLALMTGIATSGTLGNWGLIYARGNPGVSAASIGFRIDSGVRTIVYGFGSGAADTVSFDWSTGANWWLRMRVIGNNVKGRVWALGAAEGISWQVDKTGVGLDASGHVGLNVNRFSDTLTHACQYFSIATGSSATAPSPNG